MNAPVGQKYLHQNRGSTDNSSPSNSMMKANSIETDRSFTKIIASVLTMPGALK
jgi:hypothetical protein